MLICLFGRRFHMNANKSEKKKKKKKNKKTYFLLQNIKKDMSSAAVVISSALRFIYKQTTFRNIFLIFRRK